MKRPDALRKEAELRDMVEGTKCQWWQCFKYEGVSGAEQRALFKLHPTLVQEELLEFALAIVEGKPVFAGDKLWSTYFGKWLTVCGVSVHKGYLAHDASADANCSIATLSWNAPKPKTIKVELEISQEDAEYLKSLRFYGDECIHKLLTSIVNGLNK